MLVIRPSFLTVATVAMTLAAANVSALVKDPGPAGRLARSMRSGDLVDQVRTEVVRLASDPSALARLPSGTDLVSAVLGMPPSSVAKAIDPSAVDRMVRGVMARSSGAEG